MDRKNKDYLEKDFAKHKPKLFMPIFNTILAIAFTVLMVRVTIVNKVNPIYLTIVILLMLLFVGVIVSFLEKRIKKQLKIFN